MGIKYPERNIWLLGNTAFTTTVRIFKSYTKFIIAYSLYSMLHEKNIYKKIHTSFSGSHATLVTSQVFFLQSRGVCLRQELILPCMLKSSTEDVLQWYQTSQCDKLGTWGCGNVSFYFWSHKWNMWGTTKMPKSAWQAPGTGRAQYVSPMCLNSTN